MKRLGFCFLIVLLFSVNSFAQVKSAVGTVVSSDSGGGGGSVCLRIRNKTQCFEWTVRGTKFSPNFRTKSFAAWETGAEWRITYSSKDMFLRSATFTGRNIK